MRRFFTLSTSEARANCLKALAEAPEGTRVQFSDAKRTTDQNAKMWAMLTDISRQLEHGGRRYEPAQWKFIFLHAFGKETNFLPALDGKSFVPIPQSSSDLSTKEMSEFVEFLYAEGIQRGVVFYDAEPKAWRAGDAA